MKTPRIRFDPPGPGCPLDPPDALDLRRGVTPRPPDFDPYTGMIAGPDHPLFDDRKK